MRFFEIEAKDISELGDDDLRELVGRLCEAELVQAGLATSCVTWGGAQEAADGGLDVSVNETRPLKYPNFVPRSVTGFQVKKHAMGKASCTKEMLDKGSLKPVIAAIAHQRGAYIIVSGKDNCSDKMLSERLSGMVEAVASLPSKDQLILDFYGRDRIATWLRQYPGVALWVRYKLGKPLSGWRPFGRWAATPVHIADEFLTDEHPCVFLADTAADEPQPLLSGLLRTREKLRTPGSAVRIIGLSGVGKTRFAQALFEENLGGEPLPKSSAIYADLGDDLLPSALELVGYFIANDIASYIVLDNCPADVHRQLQKAVSSSGTKLRILTIEYDISDDKPEETEVVKIEPSSESTVSKLIQLRFPDLERGNADKIAEFSGGNARVAIALASRVKFDETLTNFSDEELFQRLFSQRKGKSEILFESAEALSLFYSFDISHGGLNDELSVISSISGIERRTLYRHAAELLRRQLAQKRGDWRAILPHALANRLAKSALENIAISEVNSELFKSANIRLLKSCAHRIGYLHDCKAAQDLAESWIVPGAPLGDISICNSDLIDCLNYIAPVFPATVLSCLESASMQPGFATRANPNFIVFVRLLCHLAYEDEYFDRAVGVLLKFAEDESERENNNSIVAQIKQLFSLYLSGTQASPSRRRSVIEGLLQSSEHRVHQIAFRLLDSALETGHWSSWGTFDFGARKRGPGWVPGNHAEQTDWYEQIIQLLERYLVLENASLNDHVKILLSSNFRGLWTSAGCFELLERIVNTYARAGAWPEMWVAIKNVIHFDSDRHDSELLERLRTLEKISAPADPFSEIEAYALTNTWTHVIVDVQNFSTASAAMHEKLMMLGEIASAEQSYIDRLGDRLWRTHIDSLWHFGKGLARGSVDKNAMFEKLIRQVEESELGEVQPILLVGFLHEIHEQNVSMFRAMIEMILHERKLAPYAVYLLCASPLEAWGVIKLVELAKSGIVDSWRFTHISLGRIHEKISDEMLFELLSILIELDGGLISVVQILEMRFFIDHDSSYIPSDSLLAFGRQVFLRMLAMHRDEIGQISSHGLKRIAKYCLSISAPLAEISKMVSLICDGVTNYRLYSFEITDITSVLIKNFPELFLSGVFRGDENDDVLAYMIFRDRGYGVKTSSLNKVPIERLIDWCNADQNKLKQLGGVVSIYLAVEPEDGLIENPRRVELSSHIKTILDAAEDKTQIVDIIYARARPSGWSGSLADILEVRAHAFSELLHHSALEVRECAKAKLALMEQSIRHNRARESEEHNRWEQRFE